MGWDGVVRDQMGWVKYSDWFHRTVYYRNSSLNIHILIRWHIGCCIILMFFYYYCTTWNKFITLHYVWQLRYYFLLNFFSNWYFFISLFSLKKSCWRLPFKNSYIPDTFLWFKILHFVLVSFQYRLILIYICVPQVENHCFRKSI